MLTVFSCQIICISIPFLGQQSGFNLMCDKFAPKSGMLFILVTYFSDHVMDLVMSLMDVPGAPQWHQGGQFSTHSWARFIFLLCDANGKTVIFVYSLENNCRPYTEYLLTLKLAYFATGFESAFDLRDS